MVVILTLIHLLLRASLHRAREVAGPLPHGVRHGVRLLPAANPQKTKTLSAGGEQQSVATPQAARGWARPASRHFKIQSCNALGLLSRSLSEPYGARGHEVEGRTGA